MNLFVSNLHSCINFSHQNQLNDLKCLLIDLINCSLQFNFSKFGFLRLAVGQIDNIVFNSCAIDLFQIICISFEPSALYSYLDDCNLEFLMSLSLLFI